MESPKTILQRIEKTYASPLQVATKYYTLLSILNDLNLAPREIDLLAFTAVRGSVFYGTCKSQFVELYKSSIATVDNLVSALKQKGFLVKEEGKAVLHPQLRLNFNNNLLLALTIKTTPKDEA